MSASNLRRGTSAPEPAAPVLEATQVEQPSLDWDDVPTAQTEDAAPTEQSEGLGQLLGETGPSPAEIIDRLQAENAELRTANANLLKLVGSNERSLKVSSGPRFYGRIANPRLVPGEYRLPNTGVNIESVNAALNADSSLEIPGIERRSHT